MALRALLRGARPARPRTSNLIRIAPCRVGPAVLIVISKALLGERDHATQGARAARMPQRLDANVLVIAGIVGFVEAVAATELAADRVPQQLHDLDPLLVAD